MSNFSIKNEKCILMAEEPVSLVGCRGQYTSTVANDTWPK